MLMPKLEESTMESASKSKQADVLKVSEVQSQMPRTILYATI